VRPGLRTRLRRDDGASLMLTLIFVTMVGLALAALLSYAGAGIGSARATADRHALASDTSAVLDVAIDTLRQSTYQDSAVPCPKPTTRVDFPGTAGHSVVVTCTPKAGTGTPVAGPHVTAATQPPAALLTIAPLLQAPAVSETGLTHAATGVLRITGKVDITSTITAADPAASIAVAGGPVVARGTCPLAQIITTGSKSCPDSLGSTTDPGYAQPATPVPLVRVVVPATCPAGAVVQFNPGYYDDAAALTALTSDPTCGKPFLFNPGVYFFDFRNKEMANVEAGGDFPRGDNVWTIDNPAISVVGGTKKGWVAGGVPPVPGSCISPLDSSDPNQGVQFVFGGSSRMNVVNGKVELCGRQTTTSPSLVVQGSTTPAVPSASATSVPTFDATLGVSPDVPFTTVGTVSTAAVDRQPGRDTLMRIPYVANPVTAIPAGSVLVGAKLTVVHREYATLNPGTQGGTDGDKVSVTAYPNAGRAGTALVPPTVQVTPSATVATEIIDLTGSLKKEVWTYGLSTLRLDYFVTAVKYNLSFQKLAAEQNPMQLVLTWTPPGMRGEKTPINALPNCVGNVCATSLPLITTQAAAALYLHGTTYAPLATLKINAAGVTAPVFESGIVSRSLTITGTPPAGGYAGPVIGMPALTVVDPAVYLAAYACTGTTAQCAVAPSAAGTGPWRLVGRSTVQIVSPWPVPTDGLRQVKVLNWHVLE